MVHSRAGFISCHSLLCSDVLNIKIMFELYSPGSEQLKGISSGNHFWSVEDFVIILIFHILDPLKTTLVSTAKAFWLTTPTPKQTNKITYLFKPKREWCSTGPVVD